jgi:large subunit ribosomal protein L24
MLTIRKKDKVVVLSGKDRGKQGEVVKVYSSEGTLLVSKVNMTVRHRRGTPQNPGGRKEVESPLPIARVMLVCPKCKSRRGPNLIS